ncbi:MAG: thiamine pyrophosphate binding domain-containing protein [Bacilli bacterium]|nr:thiamine pyrophosphate binding domain-containing protein [Bacilli bacterium]
MKKYSIEKNVQILIAILKAHHIKNVVISPGTTNINFVVSLINDGYFKLYSAIDERGAGYIALGLATSTGQPAVITCTGATASRNYYSSLTEAYHRKIPVIAVTASQDFNKSGNLATQYIERDKHPSDLVKMSVQVPIVRSDADLYQATIKLNRAILECYKDGGGPIHIDLASNFSDTFVDADLSSTRIMRRYYVYDELPRIKAKRVGIIIGAHKIMSPILSNAIDRFCKIYNGVVLVDHSSHYYGKYRVLPTILTSQRLCKIKNLEMDLLIHIGEEHADYFTNGWIQGKAKETWRISEDGEIRDTFSNLTNTFKMREIDFFSYYIKNKDSKISNNEYFKYLKKEVNSFYSLIPELPFSNVWMAKQVSQVFPHNYLLELGLSNTMRSYTFFEFKNNPVIWANTGCRGIDGVIPTLLGFSLANPNTPCYGIMGDLAFFYSLNILANHNINKNLRILLINNGCGVEFNLALHRAYKIFAGDSNKINEFIAAGGHNGNKSKTLVRDYAKNLGFEYLSAHNKKEFLSNLKKFLDSSINKPIIFEAFTDIENERKAVELITGITK